jgi:hypothetical protein
MFYIKLGCPSGPSVEQEVEATVKMLFS